MHAPQLGREREGNQVRILVPVDGSVASMRAVEHAALLAKSAHPCEVHLLHVQHGVPALDRAFDGRPSEVHREQELLLREPAERTVALACAPLDAAGVASFRRIEFGEPASAIVEYARRFHCDLIVMGAGRLDSVAGRLLGSVASEVVHRAQVPVTLVK